MDDIKKKRAVREENNAALGIKVDVDFQAMVEQQQENVSDMQAVSANRHLSPHTESFSCSTCQQNSLKSMSASRKDQSSKLNWPQARLT